MKAEPQVLYHYTSLDTLALILTNKSTCFNTLLNVDDIDEAETSDLGQFGKYVYVSCWTDEAAESIAMWQLYTPNMHGVRIQLPVYPFKNTTIKLENCISKKILRPISILRSCTKKTRLRLLRGCLNCYLLRIRLMKGFCIPE